MQTPKSTGTAAALAAALLTVSLEVRSGMAESSQFTIVNDSALDRAVADARREFLAGKPFDRLDATILVLATDGTWRCGSYNPEALAYPASCVKLPYMAAAMYWCRTNGKPYNYLDHCVRPMVTKSDNVQTGVVVDAITSTTNSADLTTTSAGWDEWVAKRRFTENYLRSLGLLANQTILHKTYPTNSGEMPEGAEKVAREVFGMNRMQPLASARLMLHIVKGAIEPDARDYMMELLTHRRWSAGSQLGFGLPPGAKHFNKPGLAYDTVEDIAYVVMPSGREFVLAAFSNGYVEPYASDPSPHDGSVLGGFCELLVEKAGLAAGNPPKLVLDNASPAFSATGDWQTSTSARDQSGPSFAFKKGGSGSATATWDLKVPERGKYEVCVRYPQGPDRAKDAPFTVRHAEGATTTVLVNQQKVGGRWFRLGDYAFEKGQGSVTLTDAVADPQSIVCADAVKATKWPD